MGERSPFEAEELQTPHIYTVHPGTPGKEMMAAGART